MGINFLTGFRKNVAWLENWEQPSVGTREAEIFDLIPCVFLSK